MGMGMGMDMDMIDGVGMGRRRNRRRIQATEATIAMQTVIVTVMLTAARGVLPQGE